MQHDIGGVDGRHTRPHRRARAPAPSPARPPPARGAGASTTAAPNTTTTSSHPQIGQRRHAGAQPPAAVGKHFWHAVAGPHPRPAAHRPRWRSSTCEQCEPARFWIDAQPGRWTSCSRCARRRHGRSGSRPAQTAAALAEGVTDDSPDRRSVGELSGVYRLRFDTATYFAAQDVTGCYPEIVIAFTKSPGRRPNPRAAAAVAVRLFAYRGS